MPGSVTDNIARRRFELDLEGGGQAFIDYRRKGHVVTLVHAEVPEALQGRGVGSALVRGALELARARKERVVPVCPFIVDYLVRHPQFQDLVARAG
jgi:uncharacterized protein